MEHITDITRTTERQQFLLLSTVSNFHWTQYPSLQATSVISKTRSTRYADHIVFNPDEKQHVPTSPRNRLLHLLMSENTYANYINTYVDFLLNQDKEPETTEIQPTCSHNDQPPKKKRKHAARTVCVNASAIYRECGIDMNQDINFDMQNRNVFTKFREQLLCEDVIKWRYHSDQMDVVCLNDIDSETGVLIPNSFVHVTCIKNFTEEHVISCKCEIFNMIQQAAHQEHRIIPEEQSTVYPDTSMTCVHCRFYKESLINAHRNIITKTPNMFTRSEVMVSNSLQHMNDAVILLGSALHKGTTKFSAKGEDIYSVVNLIISHGKCSMKCTNGMCLAVTQTKKKVPKSTSVKNIQSLCSHLQTMAQNIDYVKSFFPHYFTQGQTNTEIEENAVQSDQENTDDVALRPEQTNFDVQTGLWNFKALSSHKPKDMMSDVQFPHFVDNSLTLRSIV